MKVLLIQNTISEYRITIYNRIADDYDLTVVYSYGNVPTNIRFKTIHVEAKQRWKFMIHQGNLRKIAEHYNVVIGMLSPNWISISMLAFGRRSFKFIPWGIGVPASYSVRYDDKSKRLNVALTRSIIKVSDAVIFYNKYPVEKYSNMGMTRQKMFVAHNTVDVILTEKKEVKDTILFVGSLYKAKSLIRALQLYKVAFDKNPKVPIFNIIGAGDEFDDLKEWIDANGLEGKIRLLGAIYDEHILASYFSRALFCVSLGQAGLTVQKAFGYGVPFITMHDSFTGGERLDIKNGETGFLLKKDEELVSVIMEAAEKPDEYLEMGKKAQEYYDNHCTIEQMYGGVKDAIEYVREDNL